MAKEVDSSPEFLRRLPGYKQRSSDMVAVFFFHTNDYMLVSKKKLCKPYLTFKDTYTKKCSEKVRRAAAEAEEWLSYSPRIYPPKPSEKSEPLYCVCNGPQVGFMIKCNSCGQLYHGQCVGVGSAEAKKWDRWFCSICDPQQTQSRTLLPRTNEQAPSTAAFSANGCKGTASAARETKEAGARSTPTSIAGNMNQCHFQIAKQFSFSFAEFCRQLQNCPAQQ